MIPKIVALNLTQDEINIDWHIDLMHAFLSGSASCDFTSRVQFYK